MRIVKAMMLVLLWAAAVQAQERATVAHPFAGVTYTARVRTSPRPLRIHIVDVDLAQPGVRVRLTPPSGPLHTMKQTTLDFLRQQGAQVAINAHYFEPWPPPDPDTGAANLVGLAASDGRVYAPFLSSPPKAYAIKANAPALNIDAAGRASIVHRNAADSSGHSIAEAVTLHNALAGNEQIVTAGHVTIADTQWNKQLSPRTAIGLTRQGHLVLVIVDGRQSGMSEGMSVEELATLLAQECDAADALNLDGGGSSTLAMADPTPRVANVPVGVNNKPGTLRAVGSNLAIFAPPHSRPATAPAAAPPPSRHFNWTPVGLAAAACGAAILLLVILRRRRVN